MYVSTYVRTYVRSFVCSPALATSFIIQFRYNFTQVLDMTIPRTSSRFSVIGSRSRSQWLFLEKLCHHSSAFIYKPILILFHTNVKYDNILDKFEFERSRVKVKVTVAIFRKTHCHRSSSHIYRLILILFHTNV